MEKWKEFKEELREKILIFDGGMGTLLQAKSLLEKGKIPELINLEKPEAIYEIHRNYIRAGSQIIETNTFGANPIKLSEYGLEKKVKEIISSALKQAKFASRGRVYVAGSIGPTGKFLQPLGNLTFEEAVENYSITAEVFLNEGVDLFNLETFMDTKELRAAVVAIRKLSEDVPVIAMMTFQENLRTVLGTSPESAGVLLQALPVDVIGANCSLGPDGIYEVLRRMTPYTNKPLIFQPNAGLPLIQAGRTIYPAQPQDLAKYVDDCVALGTRIFAGCCGTGPEHISALKEAVKNVSIKLNDRTSKTSYRTALSSRTKVVEYGRDRCIIIGERINPAGRKKLQELLKKGNLTPVREEARAQKDAGAEVIDINVSVPDVDEAELMRKSVMEAELAVDLPLCIDSSDVRCLEEGIKNYAGKPLLNSATCEAEKLKKVINIAKLYGAGLVILPIDEKGIPPGVDGRVKIARRAINYLKKQNFPLPEVFFDALVLTVSSDTRNPSITLKTLEEYRKMGVFSIAGLSNVSFGLPEREIINKAFLSMAMEKGLNAVILNPLDENLMKAYYAVNLLLGRDEGASNFLKKMKPEKKFEGVQKAEQPHEHLKISIINGDKEQTEALTKKLLENGWDPLKISNEVLIPALEVVGEKFASSEFFLPQVILSAEAVKCAFNILRPFIKKENKKIGKKILFATVEGDVHDIGKNIVITLLESHGFDVIDLGKNVKTDEIIRKAEELKPDIIALSALMTTTMPAMKRVIEKLNEKKIDIPVAVGGACVTKEYAQKIGAKVYAEDALRAVEEFKKFFGL